MKRNPHIIVQQVCPCARTKDGKYSVLSAIVRHKGLIARFCVEHPTKAIAKELSVGYYMENGDEDMR